MLSKIIFSNLISHIIYEMRIIVKRFKKQLAYTLKIVSK